MSYVTGDIIWTPRVRVGIPVRHMGLIVAPNTVAHASMVKKAVTVDTLEAFEDGRPSYLDRHVKVQPDILDRARQLEGKPYSLLFHNCEHFVTDMVGGLPESPQLKRAGGITAVGVGLLFVAGSMARRAWKRRHAQ